MFGLLFKILKKMNFSNITEYDYDKHKLDPKLKKSFFSFYAYIKPLFGFHKINFSEKELLKLFEKEITKLSFKEKTKLIENNSFIVHFLNKDEFEQYVEKSSKSGSWWIFAVTFNNEYKKLNIDISNKSFSLIQAGRFMLNNENVKIEFIKKFLNKITIQDFYPLGEEDDSYLSWIEFLSLIEKSGLNIKEYLLDSVKKTNWIGSKTIIDGLSKLNKNHFQSIKNDKKFASKLYELKNKFINEDILLDEIKHKFNISNEKILDHYKKIENIYIFFDLPKNPNDKKYSPLFLSKQKSIDKNYDTTQVDQNYLYFFNLYMKFSFDFYKGYLDWILKEKKEFVIYNFYNPNLERINQILLEWIKERDIEISGFLALKFLKECIFLLFPNKKEDFQKKSFYEITREAAKTFEKKVKWTTEILFAPTIFFKQARNKICHFDIKDPTINFGIICLGMEYFRKLWKNVK